MSLGARLLGVGHSFGEDAPVPLCRWLGAGSASDQFATEGTAGASDIDVLPVTWRKRSQARVPVVVALAEPTPRRAHSSRTKDETTLALKPSKSRSSSLRAVREELLRDADVAHAVACETAVVEQVPLELAELRLNRCRRP